MASEAAKRVVGPSGADSPLTVLKGVGPKLAATLACSHIHDLRDLLWFFPRRMQQVREIQFPDPAAQEQLVRVPGRVDHVRLAWLPGRRSMVTVVFTAGDGTPFEAAFFNQPYLRNAWQPGTRRLVEGVLERKGRTWRLRRPRILRMPAAGAGPGGLDVRYGDLEGISEERLRGLIHQALELVDPASLASEPLPLALAAEAAMVQADPAAAVRAMHRPTSLAEHERARRYFALVEAVQVFRRVEAARRRRQRSRGPRIRVGEVIEKRIHQRIPFRLTDDQGRAVSRVLDLLGGPAPMGVLLQGDVGTGKTAVAVAAALAAVAGGHQVAFLAPTELLAEQHHHGVSRWLLGSKVAIELLTAGVAARQRKDLEQRLEAGAPCLVFGTHALLSARTLLPELGLVIIDEQHRFGVRQRMTLVQKGLNPHVLFMTATPIPRTLTFTLFGDLDLLLLRKKPPGRRDIATCYLEPRQWPRIVGLIAQHVRRGEQVFVVCPKIGAEDQDDGQEGKQDGKDSAVGLHRGLQRRFRCGLVHGQMRVADRQQVTDAFRAGDMDVLVGTTVLEVGVDVPAATLMVVVGADRFGLATLHQLRGRVGRGRRRALCVLTGKRGPRVQAVCRTTDGFALAEEDLRLRGAGELLGTRQSGMSDLRALDPLQDHQLLQEARAAVRQEPP
ncbi:MAG: ATP-dependent DNA helicase RecG [Planctomycetota bacterium]